MAEPKEYTRLEKHIGAEMRNDIELLVAKAENDARIFLAHPEWHDKTGALLPARKLKGGLERSAADNLLVGQAPEVIARIEKIGDTSAIVKRIKKAGHHVLGILRARIEYGDKVTQAVDSHKTDFEIEMRELRNASLPENCYSCLEMAHSIATASQEEHRDWRRHAQLKEYAERNAPRGVGV